MATMSRAQIQTAWSSIEHVNHEAILPSQVLFHMQSKTCGVGIVTSVFRNNFIYVFYTESDLFCDKGASTNPSYRVARILKEMICVTWMVWKVTNHCKWYLHCWIVLMCFIISLFNFNSGMCRRHVPLREQACTKDSTGSQMNFLSDLTEMAA